MNGVKADLELRLANAVRCGCWRTANALRRQLARYEEEHNGTPCQETLLRLGYDHYSRSKKKKQ